MVDDISREKTLIRKDGVRGVTRLGRYSLKKRLGIGGMAEVYLAEQDGPQQFKKTVVVKRILPSLAADAQFVQMFVREAQVAARLSHGNVVQIYELGEHVEEVVLTTNQYANDLVSECRRRGVTFRDVGAFFRSQIDAETQPAGVGVQ